MADKTLTINTGEILNRFTEAGSITAKIVAERALFDSNRFIPKDSGDLERSGRIEEKEGFTVFTWRARYARRLYYSTTSLRLTVNPDASHAWFDLAKTNFLGQWIKIAKLTFYDAYRSLKK